MVQSYCNKNIYKKVDKAYTYNNIQYYYARFNEHDGEGIMFYVETVLDHNPTNADFEALSVEWLTSCKRIQCINADGYAKSNDVKQFVVNSNSVWLDSEQRASIAKSVSDKRKIGRTSTTIYMGGVGYEMTLDQADNLLSSVEVYASDCFEITEQHKSAINAIETADEVLAYDYTAGYPEVLEFTI